MVAMAWLEFSTCYPCRILGSLVERIAGGFAVVALLLLAEFCSLFGGWAGRGSGCVWRYQMMLDFVILELTLSSKHFLPFVCQVSSRGCGFMTLTSWLGPVGGGEWVCWSWSWGCCCGFGRGWHMVEWVEGCG